MKTLLTVENIDINITTKDGTTALWVSAHNGHYKVVDLLIKAQANVNVVEENVAEKLEIYTNNYIYIRYFEWIKTMKEENKSGCCPPLNSYTNKNGVTVVVKNKL